MIVVKLEMWPKGNEEKKYDLGRMYIANTGGSVERGDYVAAVCRKGTTDVPEPVHRRGVKASRTGEVKDYPRISYNVWRLIIRAAKSCFPEEK